jgi:hypothetical protein
MLLPHSLLSTPFLVKQFLKAHLACDNPLLRIDGYPEYATKITDLLPEDQQKVKDLARKIVDIRNTNKPIVAFVVQGHADEALREPPGEKRRKKEQDVSEQRATSAQNVLLQEIMAIEPTGKLVAATIGFGAKGFGSRFRKVVPTPGHPLTESQMKKNRRIEIFTADCIVPRPEPEPKPDPKPPPQKEEGKLWRIQIKSGLIVMVPTPTDLSPGHMTLRFEVTDRDRKQKARFVAKVIGNGLPGATIPPTPVQQSQVTEGTPRDFRTTKGATLGMFEGSVSIAQNPGLGVSVLSTGGAFNFSFEEMEKVHGVFTSPTVVEAPAGSGSGTPLNAGLGAVFHGSISMEGAPVPVP